MRLFDYFMYSIDGQEIERNATIICAEMYKRSNVNMSLTMLGYHGRELEIEYDGYCWKVTIIIGHVKSVKTFYSVSKSTVKTFLTEVSKDYKQHGHDYNGMDENGVEWYDDCYSSFDPEYYMVKKY